MPLSLSAQTGLNSRVHISGLGCVHSVLVIDLVGSICAELHAQIINSENNIRKVLIDLIIVLRLKSCEVMCMNKTWVD